MRIRSLAMAVALALLVAALPRVANATTSIQAEAQGSTGWSMDFCKDSVTTNLRQCFYLMDPVTALPISPFQAGQSIGNAAFGINGSLPAGVNTIGTVNLGTIGGAAMESGGNLAALAAAIVAGVEQANTKQINGVAPLMGNGVSGTGSQRVTIASDNTPFSVNLGTVGGAATAANQTNSTQKTQIVDSFGSIIASSSNNLNVQCANCSGSGVSTADESSFIGGTSLFAGIGGFSQTTPTNNPLTSGQQGMVQMTANRALFANPRNAAGTETATAANPFRIDPTGTTTQPVAEADVGGTLGAIGALNATASVAMAGQSGAGVLIAVGTLIGTVTPEISYDYGTNWKATSFFDSTAQTTSANVVFASANPNTQLTIITPGGVTNARVKVSAYTSGTANATLRATNANTPFVAVPAAGLPVVVPGAIQGTNPGVAAAANSTVSVQFPSLDPCLTQAHTYTPINISTAANTKIVPGTAAKKTYICHMFLFGAAADNVGIVEGTGTNCATGTAGVIGGATAAAGINLVANQGFVIGTGQGAIAATATAADDFCLITSAGAQVSGAAVTAQQ
jgi:hypothetical protein